MNDLLNRQKVLDTLEVADTFLDEERTVEMYKALLTECIKVLPSAENDGDLISRQAVEDITWEEPSYTDPLNVLTEVREKVRALPSVENKGEDRPKGHWIYPSYPNNYPYMWKSICSNCNTGFPTINKDYKFCPECGANMRGSE